MAHTGLLSLGSLVLRIMAQPQAALFWLSCIHSEDSKQTMSQPSLVKDLSIL